MSPNAESDALIRTQTLYTERVFEGVQLQQAELVSSEFDDCAFVRCSFAESVFRKCRFAGCVFQHCDLSLVQLPDSSFSASRFEDSKIIGVNWTEAHWPTTRLWEPVHFSKCIISHSTFIGLNLNKIRITDSAAEDVDFREADLSLADFSGTDLSKSLFINTNLTKADLSRARNYTIDAAQNVLKGCRFSLPEAMSLLYGLDIDLIEGEP
jgi:uncharacterized protein YjbI with pentapeptide repeats